MNSLFILLVLAVVVYFVFRKGGMGCCRGHGSHGSPDYKHTYTGHSALHKKQSQTIDLDEADYTILPSETTEKLTRSII